jgi:hypothetical protein
MEQLGEYDVVFGRGHKNNTMRRASLYAKLLDKHCEEYRDLELDKKQQFVIDMVILPIQEKNGRFLKNEENRWVDESDHKVTKTVMQAFRDRAKYLPLDEEKISQDEGLEEEEEEDSSVSSDEELPTFRANVLSLLGNQINKSEADDQNAERVDQILQSVESNLQAMSSQLKRAMGKINDLLYKNQALRGENQALQGENEQLRRATNTLNLQNQDLCDEVERLRLVSRTAAI